MSSCYKMSSSYNTIRYHVDNGIGRIVLNRPDKRNALSAELISELHDAVRASAIDPAVRVVLLTGAGADFCSGADLSGLQRAFAAGALDQMADARNFAELFQDMRRHPRPVVAAVRGRALAGGCGLATACDLILAAESAQFGYPEVNIGFVPAIVMALLRRSLPEKRAFELIAMGETFSASAAHDIGLVNQVFAEETFDIDVDAYAAKLAAKSASALQLSKSLLYHMDGMGFEGALQAGVQINAIARMTDDCKRGIERFLKKSPIKP
jgi:methylglutaconyl-CoA hydratase